MNPELDRPVAAPSVRHGWFCALAWVLCSVFYFSTVHEVTLGHGDQRNVWHHYDYLTDGFLSGHLHLSLKPAPELLALADARNPAQNGPYRLEDASFYQGEYYLYFGPTPVVLLLLPWKFVTGHHLSQWMACGLLASLGLAAIACLLRGIQRECFPAVSPLQLFFAVLLAGHLSWLPVILRHPAVWELPIITAAALLWWGLYFLWRYHASGGLMRWAVAGGIALALVPGARPTCVVSAGVVALLFLVPVRPGTSVSRQFLSALAVGLPILLGGVALLLYNYYRFGQPLDFGQQHQLWAQDWRGVVFFRFAYLPFNAWLYFFSPPSFAPYFPFIHPGWIDALPTGYTLTEDIHGLCFAMPAQFLGFVAVCRAWASRGQAGGQPWRIVVVGAAGASLLLTALLCCFAGASSRYVVEIAAGWTVASGIGFLALFSDLSGKHRTSLRLITGVVAAWSIAYVWLASFEFHGFARTSSVYQSVGEVLNRPSYWAAQRSRQQYGPVALELRLPAQTSASSTVLLATGAPGMVDQLIVERMPPDLVRLRLAVNDLVMAETPWLHHPDPTLRVECHAPWLYPPVAHPFWRSMPDEADRRLRQTLFGLRVEGNWYARRSEWVFDATAFEPTARTAAGEPLDGAWVEKMTRVESSPAPGSR